MHVLINAASAHMGGAVTFLKNAVPALAGADDELAVTVVAPAATVDQLAGMETARLRLQKYPHPRTSGMQRMYFDQYEVPRLVNELNADILFSSTGFGTFRSPRPQVLLVRNMAYFDPIFHQKYRELGRSLRKNTMRRWHSLLSVRTADIALFPTGAIRDAVGRYIHLRDDRTRVIHYGFDHARFARTADASFAWTAKIEQWKRDEYVVLLNVSTFAVQKNVETLVEAMGVLRARGRKVKLLTTISRDKTTDIAEYEALYRRARTLAVDEDVIELGYIPYDELGSVYRAADLYVFPSFTESFGHSLVEAMAAGKPVVAANSAVNVEVCGSAGAYFESFDAESCANVINDILSDEMRLERMREASIARANAFSWRVYGESLIRLFHDLVAGQRQPVRERMVEA